MKDTTDSRSALVALSAPDKGWSSLDAAIWASERGHAVVMMVPVKAGKKKQPAEKWAKLGYRSPAELRRIWRRNVGTAIVTRPSGLVDIDLDTVDGEPVGEYELIEIADWRDISATMEVVTPTGGRHLAFRSGGIEYKSCAGQVAPHIDIRGHGGLFVIHSGNPRRPYVITDTRMPVGLPGWLADVLPLAGSRSASASSNGDGPAIDIQELLENGVAPGKQEGVLYRLIWRLRNDDVSRESAYIIWSNILARSVTGVDAKGNKQPEWTRDDFNGKWDGADEKVSEIERNLEEAGFTGQGKELVDPRSQMREDFWNAREELALIRKWAQARMVSPMAVLGEVLAEVVCHIPPFVQLPPLIGGPGTLNMLIALTGHSGTGKGGASGVARDAIRCDGFMDRKRIPIGSGEGIPKAFGHMQYYKDTGLYDIVRTSYSTIIEVKEIDSLTAIKSRVSGSTLTAQLNQFYSGEQLGYWYSDVKNRVIIPEHLYRGCVVAGVQPGRGAIILDDTDSGFAQRWLWLPATDPNAPVTAPDVPGIIIDWNMPEDIPEDNPWRREPYFIEVCQEATDKIKSARRPVLVGQTDGLEGHKLYTRLKVAAALALLDHSTSVNDEDWDLAGYLINISDGVRHRSEEELRRNAVKAAHVRGKLEGVRASVANETTQQMTNDRIAKKIISLIPDNGEWVSAGEGIKNKIAARDRELLPEVLADLVEAGKLETREIMYRGRAGVQYRSAPR